MKIGRVIASLLIQNVKNAVNTFEELLSNHNVDHSMEQHFREQLAKGSQLAERLASQFNTGNECIKPDRAWRFWLEWPRSWLS
jgi:hypothetical protein